MAIQERKAAFRVDVSWDGKKGGKIKTRKGSTLRIDIPKMFGGEGKHLCPDELFLSAIGGCLLTTFLYLHKKVKFKLKGLRVIVNGDVQSQGSEGYRISSVRVNLSVQTDREGEEQARKCIEMTQRFCHITRSIEKAIPLRILSNVVVKTGKMKLQEAP